jgi:hypothetical protein
MLGGFLLLSNGGDFGCDINAENCSATTLKPFDGYRTSASRSSASTT